MYNKSSNNIICIFLKFSITVVFFYCKNYSNNFVLYFTQLEIYIDLELNTFLEKKRTKILKEIQNVSKVYSTWKIIFKNQLLA